MSANLTTHASERAKVRGIPMRIVEAIYNNADWSVSVGKGCQALTVSRKQLDQLTEVIPAADRERMKNIALVTDAFSNSIITVLHIRSRKARHYYRR
jgi:hypothetical protein